MILPHTFRKLQADNKPVFMLTLSWAKLREQTGADLPDKTTEYFATASQARARGESWGGMPSYAVDAIPARELAWESVSLLGGGSIL